MVKGSDYDNSEGSSNPLTETSDERDEVEEVRNVARHDTVNVRMWRLAVTSVLLFTAVAVTVTTYFFLRREQDERFETAFEQFSRTVGDAAYAQQIDIRESYRTFADHVSGYAQSTNATWPFFSLPLFEKHARNLLTQSHTEIIVCNPIVPRELRDEWIEYANTNYEKNAKESHMIRYGGLDRLDPVGYKSFVSRRGEDGFIDEVDRDYVTPIWHYSPPPYTYGLVNWDTVSIPSYDNVVKAIIELKNESVSTEVRGYAASVGTTMTQEEHEAMHSKLADSSTEHPHAHTFHPVHAILGDDESPVVAFVGGAQAWDASLRSLLPEGVVGIVAVLANNCNQTFTYEIDGPGAFFQGAGDLHESQYDKYRHSVYLSPHTHPNFTKTPGHCQFTMHVYPSSRFEDSYDKKVPEIYAAVVACTFVLIAAVYFIYDMFVQRRNEKMVENAARSNAIVSSMLPSNIRDRLIGEKADTDVNKSSNATKRVGNLRMALQGGMQSTDSGSKPLADLFLDTSVIFADICGFTAWASVREPSQVFTLLETLYASFDRIAKKRRVFKVETVGDCYVAATGIPNPLKDHTAVLVRFARDIISRMHILSKELEVTLGPDTGDLSLRVGIHSGPVTAGLLRGERTRFQLFGDTMNTASRIADTGATGRIHISSEAAECLKRSKKGHWLVKREGGVVAKGKGDIQTYWIGSTLDRRERASSCGDSTHVSDIIEVEEKAFPSGDTSGVLDEKALRVVDWNVEMLLQLIKQIVARRQAKTGTMAWYHATQKVSVMEDFTPLEEVKEIITLPEFDKEAARREQNPDMVEISEVVLAELRMFVMDIANMYRANEFHNFEHASHVTMSVIKMLSRIVAPSDIVDEYDDAERAAHTLHDHTYGITSDPLTQFACAFSALIHDVDHEGVPNTQLVKEGSPLAKVYENRSVAEQNSLVLAMDLLMLDRFTELRACLCADETELKRFRQLAVNAVMATDIMDKDLKALRNNRWEKAFKQTPTEEEHARDGVNRKATIVIEHLIQASDIAHTMQHWHVYRKWNERFYRECHAAYQAGRAEKDPTDSWYKGEIGFFDFYIIPLAKKLKDCGVFGKSSDEFLNYALANRKEWEDRGEAIVAEMAEAVNKESESTDTPEPVLVE